MTNRYAISGRRLVEKNLAPYVYGDMRYQTGMYNVKMIVYANGECEVRTYSQPVGRQAVNMDEELLAVRQKVARDYNKIKEHVIYNPFDDIEMQVRDLDELEIEAIRKERSLQNSYSRTVQKIYEIARQCKWEYFITLTFSDEVVDRMDFDACMKKANKWFNNQRRNASDLQYIFVPEEHKKGGWHIHGLLANTGNIAFNDSGHFTVDKQKIYNMTGWRFGFSTATKVTDTHRVSGYITKYITKDLCKSTDGKRRYYRSQNIPEPWVTNFMVDGNEKVTFADMLADSIGMTETYHKDISGYVEVNYKYYKKEM